MLGRKDYPSTSVTLLMRPSLPSHRFDHYFHLGELIKAKGKGKGNERDIKEMTKREREKKKRKKE
jgi:hypothetical protein